MQNDKDYDVLHESIFNYGNAMEEALKGKEWGEFVEFTCPLCGGEAGAVRSTYNGHYHSKCENCGFGIIQ